MSTIYYVISNRTTESRNLDYSIGENQVMFSVCLKKNISHTKMFWKKIFDKATRLSKSALLKSNFCFIFQD